MNQQDAIMLTLGKNFLDKVYPGGREAIIKALERCENGEYTWMQFCGSGVPARQVEFVYLIWDGKVQYRMTVLKYIKNRTGTFDDGGVERSFSNRNMVVMTGPTIKAPRDIPAKGFQGLRYTEFLF